MLLTACNALPRMGAVPNRQAALAVLPGLSNVRYMVVDEQDMRRLSQDVAFMLALYELGFQLAKNGNIWKSKPHGFEPTEKVN